MDKKRLLKSELIGLTVSVALSFLLHYIYPLTANSKIAAVFGSVNESVWEHLKILVFAYLLWIPAGLIMSRVNFRRYITAKTLGALFLMVITTFFFYIYSGIVGTSVVWVDIASAVVWMAFAYLLSARLMDSPADLEGLFIICLFVLALLITAFLCFTPNPPPIGLFKDPRGFYGIPTV